MKIIGATQTWDANNQLPHFYSAYIPFCAKIFIHDLKGETWCEFVDQTDGIEHGPREWEKLIETVLKENADWLVYSETDSLPSWKLRDEIAGIITAADQHGYTGIAVRRIYIYGEDKYFAGMPKSKSVLWAWKIDKAGAILEKTPREKVLVLDDPFFLVNHHWESDEAIAVEAQKAELAEVAFISPLVFAAPLEERPRFAQVQHPPVKDRK